MRRLQCHQGQTMLYSRELDISVIMHCHNGIVLSVWCLHTLKLFNEYRLLLNQIHPEYTRDDYKTRKDRR